jgi:hypothetical protein
MARIGLKAHANQAVPNYNTTRAAQEDEMTKTEMIEIASITVTAEPTTCGDYNL